jgi:hypothetical protein
LSPGQLLESGGQGPPQLDQGGSSLDLQKIAITQAGYIKAKALKRSTLDAPASQITPELATRDREQPAAHLLRAVQPHLRPTLPRLREVSAARSSATSTSSVRRARKIKTSSASPS